MKEMVGGCCVCSDDRGWSENPLVYCDGQSCAVAVHQACYGIVTVPSGPWYCRKCESQERSARVRCELCPSRDGALKRTDNQGWAHVVCALYIPEVRFGNVTTMEPIILQLIPQERYNKSKILGFLGEGVELWSNFLNFSACYICQEMGKGSRSTAGACMQCNKSGCKQQFHVTCAQQLGLLCEEAGNYLDNVKYCGYCQHHYSKLKKGGNVKTIPPYKPISHETNSSDGPSSPEKELEPASSGQQQHSSGSAMGGNSNSGSGNMKSNSRMPGGELGGSSSAAASSSSSSSKQRKSSSASKSSAGSSSTSGPTSGGMLSGTSNSLGANSQSTSSASSGITGMGSGSAGSSTMPGSNNKTSASSSSGSTKDKDKYSKNVNKVSGTNKGHDKEPSSSSSSSSSSSQRDKSSKSSKSSGGTNSNSNPSGLGSSASNVNSVSSSLGNSLPKENDPLSSSLPSTMNSSLSNKHQDGIKQEKTLAQISSAAASTARAASLSPAAIPTTLIIKPPHDHSGSNKDLLSKEAIAKFTTSNFTETIVVNSDSVFGTTSSTSSNSSSNNAGGPTSQSSGIGSNMAPTSVIENTPGGGSSSGSKQLSMSGGGNSSYTGSGVAKKRKADARSTPTSIASGDIDINRDLIKDVAVSLVPLPLNKNDNIDPASLSGFEKSIKKRKDYSF
ncbi:mixed-lineage leukemia protein [Culex quinquefasciatus]|uniref:Mixed-lineage leukemia protein n=1 Tax=Culex quinquefasciatus TaxID=7176 RepID=B0WG32_CULQU|nr:mixed-lineage leukemia protein [Culex quinquefasciatus]|eukprot:XP_001847666.1 mixed-lineage leukemia protein [Culex quinquefasciatus]